MFFLPLFSFILGAAFLFAAFSAPDNSGNTAVGLFFLAFSMISFLIIRKKQPRSASSGAQAPRAASGLSPWLKILLAWIAWGVLFVSFFQGFRISNLFHTLLILAASFVVLILFTMHQLTGPSGRARRAAAARQPAGSSAPAAEPAPAEDSGSITFRVAGTTFDNDDGTSRQDILRHLKFGDAPWADDPDDLVATIEEETYEGELAFAVLINGYKVGFVPRIHIRKVEEARRNVATCYVSDVQITGGGYSEDGQKLSYGCSITLEY